MKKLNSDQDKRWDVVADNIFYFFRLILVIGLVGFFGGFGLFYWGLVGEHKFNLPYNAIDFQKIAYIDNQFVMYGVDYNAKYDKQLVIFTSLDGKKWDKALIAKVKPENESDARHYYQISDGGTFAYFNHQCMLIGAVAKVLVSPDCHNWSYLETKQDNGNPTPFWSTSSAVVVNDSLYVGTNRNGVYQSKDGITWHKEPLPYPQESDPRNFENSFLSMAAGNNKLITSTSWMYDGKNVSLIYTKNLITGKWSYEIYPASVGHITRGKDRFVGLNEGSALVLLDGSSEWFTYPIAHHSLSLSYGLDNKFIGVGGIQTSVDGGKTWLESDKSNKNNIWALNVACSVESCVGVGIKYQIIRTNDGINWHYVDFGYKNPKPHWWRRFF